MKLISQRLILFRKRIKIPGCILLVVVLGYSGLTGFFSEPKKPQTTARQLSSFSEKLNEVRETEYETINRLTDQQVLKELEKTKPKWSLNGKEDFSVSPDEIDKIEKRHRKQLPKRFKDNPAFMLFEQLKDLISQKAQTTLEDPALCEMSRKSYENQIEQSPQIQGLISLAENVDFEARFSKRCVTHIMNQFAMPGAGYATCPSSSGNPKISGNKPCVTENLVNLTYNSYMTVADCLNLAPKLLISKIEFESGFLINSVNQNQNSGLGQLNRTGVIEVNKQLDFYLQEIEKGAAVNRSCANLLKFKALLTRASEGSEQKCALIGLPENPLRSIFYMAVLNKINMQKLEESFTEHRIGEKLEQLGIKNPDLKLFQEMLALSASSIGVPTSMNIFLEYLNKRLENNLLLTDNDFDFTASKNSVAVARNYVMSSFFGPKDSSELKLQKVKKRKELPKLWATSYTRTFPEHLAFRANTYDGKSITYSVLGFPGYLNLVAERNSDIRNVFENSDLDPDLCTDPNFLKLTR